MFELINPACALAVPLWQPDFAHEEPSAGDPVALAGDPSGLEYVLVLSRTRIENTIPIPRNAM